MIETSCRANCKRLKTFKKNSGCSQNNLWKNLKSYHCVKNARIQSFSGPIAGKCGKTPNTDSFHVVYSLVASISPKIKIWSISTRYWTFSPNGLFYMKSKIFLKYFIKRFSAVVVFSLSFVPKLFKLEFSDNFF